MATDDEEAVGRSRRLRTRLARRGTLAASATSRRLGIGSGSTIGGRVGLAIDPSLLAHLGLGRTIALVSGTNGKTTSTRMLAEAMGTMGPVAFSRAGANMTAGLVAALASAGAGVPGVLEVDEAHLPSAIEALSPVVVVLLNLSRDQLDRVSEVRSLAERWRHALAGRTCTVVANADDPLVVHAALDSPQSIFVGTGARWHGDAHHCPRCDAAITFDVEGADGSRPWACSCGFARPALDAWIDEHGLVLRDGPPVPFELSLPGRFNVANAAMVTVAAAALGVDPADAARAISALEEVEGRFASTTIAGRRVRLLLAKNPAGYTELLELVASTDGPVVIGVNARIADGHDPSWLWDVPFEVLRGRRVVATGERAGDLAVRLLHAGAEVTRVDDQRDAIEGAPEGEIAYIGNYTAFQDLRRTARPHRSAPSPKSPAVELSVTRAKPSPGASRIRIVTVHPDLLGTYGDGGNGRVLANRARWRGYAVELITASSDLALPEDGDLYLLGGGEDGPQLTATEALRSGSLARAIDRGATVLAVCAGYQILGNVFPGPDGSPYPGLGLLDVTTARGVPRAVGEIVVSGGGRTLTGFENHGGRTTRADGVEALGVTKIGIGNGDGTDGAVTGRLFATYLHGPLLARNPQFADELLALVVGEPLASLEDDAAETLHTERLARASALHPQKVTRAG